MKYLRSKLFILITLLAVISGCSVDDGDQYCFQSVQTGFDTVIGPETTTVDEPIVLQTTFKIANGCGAFSRFAESNGFPKQIAAVVNYAGCTCTEQVSIETKPYTFEASDAGEYVLKFIKPDQTFITKTITVTE